MTKKKKVKKKKEKEPFTFYSKDKVFGRTKKEIKNLIQKQVDKTSKRIELSDKEKEMQVEALTEVFLKGKSPRNAMGIDDTIVQMLYAFAYTLYNGGKYEEANRYFKFLTLLDPTPKHFLGLAASYHRLEEYEKAIEVYYSCAFLEEDNPVPFFYMYDCYEKLHNPVGVLLALNGCTKRCVEDPKYAKLKGRCLAILGKLEGEEPETSEGVEEGEEVDYFKQLQQSAMNPEE